MVCCHGVGWTTAPSFAALHVLWLMPLAELGRFAEAERLFDRMLWLNPSDNQGVRFIIDQVRAKVVWQEAQQL